MRLRLPTVMFGGISALIICLGTLSTGGEARGDGAAADGESGGSYSVEESPDGRVVLRDGEKIAEYVTRSGSKPILFPVLGPDGVEMTRGYPMRPAGPHERDDHPHHRSFWFTHGEVNGVDFWAEGANTGSIRHRDFAAAEGGSTARIATTNDWVDTDGNAVLSDERMFVFGDDGQHRFIDVDVTLRADHGPVHFGDTKEGTFGIRIAGTMKVDEKLGGTILTSRGEKDGKAWGTRAEWVDYVGPIDDKTYGITIMNHPSSFAFPCRWHVRTYGLFAANPFGEQHFVGGDASGGTHLDEGDSLRLRYRVLLHRGTTEEAGIDEAWERYQAAR